MKAEPIYPRPFCRKPGEPELSQTSMMAASLTVGAPFAGVRPCQKPCSRASGRGALVCRAQAQGEANIKASTSAEQLALDDQNCRLVMI